MRDLNDYEKQLRKRQGLTDRLANILWLILASILIILAIASDILWHPFILWLRM